MCPVSEVVVGDAAARLILALFASCAAANADVRAADMAFACAAAGPVRLVRLVGADGRPRGAGVLVDVFAPHRSDDAADAETSGGGSSDRSSLWQSYRSHAQARRGGGGLRLCLEGSVRLVALSGSSSG